ncbi:hypothetical protein NM96060_2234 [Neisseria meningitidis 96060]|nr:hypothetical protein NM96060_2234 [Neisseria meningitidis 96060]
MCGLCSSIDISSRYACNCTCRKFGIGGNFLNFQI